MYTTFYWFLNNLILDFSDAPLPPKKSCRLLLVTAVETGRMWLTALAEWEGWVYIFGTIGDSSSLVSSVLTMSWRQLQYFHIIARTAFPQECPSRTWLVVRVLSVEGFFFIYIQNSGRDKASNLFLRAVLQERSVRDLGSFISHALDSPCLIVPVSLMKWDNSTSSKLSFKTRVFLHLLVPV
jgi:hypothetical protein